MNKPFCTATAGILLLISAGPVFAAQTSGKITKVDRKTDAIVLDNGKTYSLSEGVEAESLLAGQKVRITYKSNSAGKLIVSTLQQLK